MEKKAAVRTLSTLLMVSMLNILLTQTPLVEASPTTVLSVDPTGIIDPAFGAGSIFRINITVADVQDFWGFQFILGYDTSILTATSYGLYPPLGNFAPSEINDAAGYVALAAYTYMGDHSGFDTVPPAPIAWIEFIVDDIGTSVLDLHGPYNGSILATWWGDAIPHEDVDGFFDNRLQVIMAITDIDPDIFNLKSKAMWITAYVQLPEEYDAEDIDATTILLNETIQPVLDPEYDFVTNSSEYLVDNNGDGVLERMVKFDRAMVSELILASDITNGHAILTITGEVDGTSFEGEDAIRVFLGGGGSGRRK